MFGVDTLIWINFNGILSGKGFNMSFDIFFQSCNISDQTEEAVNPFTGEVIQKPIGEVATDAERAALIKLFAAAEASEANEHGCSITQFADGGSAEAFFDALGDDNEFSGGMLAVRGLSTELTQFMYSLAEEGNLAMLPAMEGVGTIVTSNAKAQRVVSRWPDAIVVSSPDELHVILSQGFDGWKSYRDQIVDGT